MPTKEYVMGANGSTPSTVDDTKVPMRQKLAALWASVMFVYIYVDILALFKPGFIEDILSGIVWQFEINQAWALGALALMTIPALMVFLSLALPAKTNRLTNIVVAALYIPISIANAIGEPWVYYFAFAAGVEVVLLALVIRYAWTWPTTGPATVPDTHPLSDGRVPMTGS
jgi:hypothetical protein